MCIYLFCDFKITVDSATTSSKDSPSSITKCPHLHLLLWSPEQHGHFLTFFQCEWHMTGTLSNILATYLPHFYWTCRIKTRGTFWIKQVLVKFNGFVCATYRWSAVDCKAVIQPSGSDITINKKCKAWAVNGCTQHPQIELLPCNHCQLFVILCNILLLRILLQAVVNLYFCNTAGAPQRMDSSNRPHILPWKVAI